MKNQEISNLIGQKRAYNSSSFLLYISKRNENKGQKSSRNIAILVSKKNFKTAVSRNTARRRIRNAVNRVNTPVVNEYNLIFSLKKGFEKVVFDDLVNEIKQSFIKNAII